MCSRGARTGTLHSLRSLAHHHLGAVLDELLNAPIPHPPMVVKSFQVIAKDEGLVLPEVNFFTHILNNTQVIEDKVDPKNRRYSQGFERMSVNVNVCARVYVYMRVAPVLTVASAVASFRSTRRGPSPPPVRSQRSCRARNWRR